MHVHLPISTNFKLKDPQVANWSKFKQIHTLLKVNEISLVRTGILHTYYPKY